MNGFCFIRLCTADMNDLDYTKVWLEGEFDHSREVLIGYRPNFQPDRTPKGFKANFGLLVVTPFKLKDTGCVNIHVIFSSLLWFFQRYCWWCMDLPDVLFTVDKYRCIYPSTDRHNASWYILIIIYSINFQVLKLGLHKIWYAV